MQRLSVPVPRPTGRQAAIAGGIGLIGVLATLLLSPLVRRLKRGISRWWKFERQSLRLLDMQRTLDDVSDRLVSLDSRVKTVRARSELLTEDKLGQLVTKSIAAHDEKLGVMVNSAALHAAHELLNQRRSRFWNFMLSRTAFVMVTLLIASLTFQYIVLPKQIERQQASDEARLHQIGVSVSVTAPSKVELTGKAAGERRQIDVSFSGRPWQDGDSVYYMISRSDTGVSGDLVPLRDTQLDYTWGLDDHSYDETITVIVFNAKAEEVGRGYATWTVHKAP